MRHVGECKIDYDFLLPRPGAGSLLGVAAHMGDMFFAKTGVYADAGAPLLYYTDSQSNFRMISTRGNQIHRKITDGTRYASRRDACVCNIEHAGLRIVKNAV